MVSIDDFFYYGNRVSFYHWDCPYKTITRNIKLCITSGTLVGSITFIICLPAIVTPIKDRAATNLLLQLVPPIPLTVVNMLEGAWWLLEYILITAINYLRSLNVRQ